MRDKSRTKAERADSVAGAARDLLDALRCVQEWLMFSRPLDRPDLWHPLFVKANDLTCAAIAKAEIAIAAE